jgi:hypothetical protein
MLRQRLGTNDSAVEKRARSIHSSRMGVAVNCSWRQSIVETFYCLPQIDLGKRKVERDTRTSSNDRDSLARNPKPHGDVAAVFAQHLTCHYCRYYHVASIDSCHPA